MAHKTFISYKNSEATGLRDRIIEALGEDAKYYQGEHSGSPDMSDEKTEKIRNYLKDMIWGTSVTIVIISPHICESEWISWEISYSLRMVGRGGITSRTNGVVGVIQKVNGSYDWLVQHHMSNDGCCSVTYNNSPIPEIILKNRNNAFPTQWFCQRCGIYDEFKNSYISFVFEDTFLSNPQLYIEDAYNKSQHLEGFNISCNCGL